MSKKIYGTILFFFVLAIHSSSLNITQLESIHVIPTSISIINEGNMELSEYSSFIPAKSLGFDTIGDKVYHQYPIGHALVATPFVFCFKSILGDAEILFRSNRIERLIASTFIAISTLIVFEIMQLIGVDLFFALFISIFFAIGTGCLSTASRSLSSHPFTITSILGTIWLFRKSEKENHFLQYVALPVSLSLLFDFRNLILLFVLLLYVIFFKRNIALKFLFWVSVIIIPFFLFNYFTHDTLFENLNIGTTLANNNLLEVINSVLFSPNRGFFFWHPVFICSFIGVCGLYYRNQIKYYDKLFILHFVLFTLLIASSSAWWGSHCIGSRIFTDMIPYGIYFLGLFVEHLQHESVLKRRIYVGVIFVLGCIGVGIHSWTANNAGTVTGAMEWNGFPKNIDKDVNRIWDIEDSQFLRGTPFSKYSYSKLEEISLEGSIKQLHPNQTVVNYNTQFPFAQFGHDWWQMEQNYIYNRNNKSALFFKTNLATFKNRNPRLRIKLKRITESPIKMTINNFATLLALPKAKEITLEIKLPQNCLHQDFNSILFEVDQTKHLSVFDTREIGFAFYYLSIE
jgi:hypothetical protein